YEVANNSYAKGMTLTIAGDCVGTGPRLQLLSDDTETNRIVEQAFAEWATAVDLAAKLRTMRMAKSTDGEAFAVLVSNPRLDHPVKLDVRLIEAEQVATPVTTFQRPDVIDGIELDNLGNPQAYHVLQEHPGAYGIGMGFVTSRRISAQSMLHWFRADRPGQHRGVPEITPALPLFAQLRRYTLAVLGAAETAADFAAVLYTDAPANGEATPVEPLDVIELEKRMATTLPDGWKLGQIKAEQPGTAYAEFKREILGEIGRCLQVPINVITGDSSQHNYASGRLDHQTYFKSLRIEQSHLGRVVMDRIFSAWIAEAALLKVFAVLRSIATPVHQFFWDGMEHVDPAKEANAQATRLTNNTTTLAYEYARQGKDWEAELRQRAKERQLMKELGLVTDQPTVPTASKEEDTDDQQRHAA
ncbi:MAG: phage portal protein, partial [Pirellulales bacterium]|nr:phage portal protein [Pirellulales bacterium]